MRTSITSSLVFALLARAAIAQHVDVPFTCHQRLTSGPPNPFCDPSWVDGSVRNHAVIVFDLASLVPVGSTVTQANFSAHYFSGAKWPASVEFHELLQPRCPGGVWSGPMTGLGAPAGPVIVPGTAAFVAVVQHWVDNPGQNFGLLLAASAVDSEACLSNVFLNVDFVPPQPCVPPVSYCIAAPNSQGPNGAHLSITGSSSLAQNDLVLVASGVRPGAPGFFYFGATQQQIPLGNGYSCAGTPLFRLAAPNLFADASGVLRRPVDFTVGSALNIQPGSVWNFQVKYRDIPGGGAGYNFTDGLQLTFCP